MNDKDGGPAFPFRYEDGPYRLTHTGMSLRDWFAGQALMGLEAGGPYDGWTASHTATLAYQIADAMLEARADADAMLEARADGDG